MLRRMLLPTVAITLATTLPAHAQVRFEWKLKAGEKFYIEEVVEQDQTFDVLGKKIPQSSITKRISEVTVKSADKDGYTLQQEILSWHHKNKSAVGKDSETHLEQLLGNSRFIVRVLRSGAIVRFDGHKDFMQRFNEVVTEAEAKLVSPMLTEEALRSPLNLTFDVLPRRAIKPGDVYEKVIAIPLGPIGTAEARSKFTYAGQNKGVDEFSIKGEFTFKPGKGPVGDGNLRITKFDLQSPGTKGSVTFDRASGRLVRCTFTVPMSGSMSMEGNGKQLNMLLEGTEIRTIRLSKTNPHNGPGA